MSGERVTTATVGLEQGHQPALCHGEALLHRRQPAADHSEGGAQRCRAVQVQDAEPARNGEFLYFDLNMLHSLLL